MKSEEVKGAAKFVIERVVSEKEILEMRTAKLRYLRYEIVRKEHEIVRTENGEFDRTFRDIIEFSKCTGRNPLEQFSVPSMEHMEQLYGEKYAKEVLARINGAI